MDKDIRSLVDSCEKEVQEEFRKIEKIAEFNSEKVLNAFIKCNITEACFSGTTGYGYNDFGRYKIEEVYKEIFKSEDSLVRTQFISGTHALTTTLFGLLRPGDILLSVSGKPYDTLDGVIGIKENPSSLKSFHIGYEQIDLIEDDFDYEKIAEYLKNNKVKVIEIQRSKGYSTRKSLSLSKVEKVIHLIKKIQKDAIVMIDNCYCEFVTTREPVEVGADIVIGSLIKNLGGGIAPNGAYVVGRKDLIELVSERLTVPGEGKEVGPTFSINKQILQGLFLSPSVVEASLKTAVLTSRVLEKLGYEVEPKYNDQRVDIVQNIIFNNKDDLISFTKGIQKSSPIDSSAEVEPWDMPGYTDPVIMASGSFTQGSSIELSCDGPVRAPYIAYMQGSLTYQYGKLALIKTLKELKK